MRFAVDGDDAFLHGLQQGGLRFGGRAVDFVGEEKSSEDGSAEERPFAALQVVDVGAGDVGRHQVRRELDPVEFVAEHGGQRPRQQRLGDAGHAFQQGVLVGQHDDKRQVNGVILADDHLGHLGAGRGERGVKVFEFRGHDFSWRA